MEKYDVIIIGAGIGGLTAGAILARNGKKVLVLEKNPVAGGYAVNFRRGEFTFDTSLHMLDGCSEGQTTYNILTKCGILNKLRLLNPDYVYRTIFPDFDFRVPQMSIPEYINILCNYFPKECKGIEKLFQEMSKIFYDGRKFIYSKIPLSIEIFSFPFKYPSLLKYSNVTFQSLMNKFLKDDKLKVIISQFWLYLGLPPSKLCAFYPSYATIDYLNNGASYIKGGGQSLSNAFVDSIRESGGQVIFNAEVEKIIIENKAAKGVIIRKGDNFFADIIISGMDANKTFLKLVGENNLNKRFTYKIKKLDPATSLFGVYLGLNVNLKEKGIIDYEIFYNPSYDLDQQFEYCIMNDMENVPFIVAIHSNLDTESYPRDKGVMSIVATIGYDYWKNLSRDIYEKRKVDLANILIKRTEKIIPNLSSYIKIKEIATPLTMERYTGNYKGSIYGWSQLVRQSGIRRLSQNTPIKNLYLASAWTRPGGGMVGVMYSGEHIAEEILRKS